MGVGGRSSVAAVVMVEPLRVGNTVLCAWGVMDNAVVIVSCGGGGYMCMYGF